MLMFKKQLTRIGIFLLCLICLIGLLPQDVEAATSGGKGSATITVKTKAVYTYPGSSSITLQQSKQTLTYTKKSGSKTKTKSGYYGCYTIKVKNCSTGKTKSYSWRKSKSKKISLSKNTTYQITVYYEETLTWMSNLSGYTLTNVSSPYWKVSSKWKISTIS